MASILPLAEKIDCIRLYVSDLDAGLAFYQDQLGHELIWRTDEAMGLRMPHTDAEIVLHTTPSEPEIDIKVRDADVAAAQFEAAGGNVIVAPFEIQIGRAVVVQDPWGNQFVLLDDRKGRLATDDAGNVVGLVSRD